MDNKDNYPVLIHCYHGTGRAEMYSALYRIEYENFTNEDARMGVDISEIQFFDDAQRRIFRAKSRSELASKNRTLCRLSFGILNFSHFIVENK
jgi:hypothetical protein